MTILGQIRQNVIEGNAKGAVTRVEQSLADHIDCAGYRRHPGENGSSSSPLVIMVKSIQNRNST